MKNKIDTGVLIIPFFLFLMVLIVFGMKPKQEVNQMIDDQFNERISSGNCAASGTEEIWRNGDVIIVKKYNCADGSILKRETEK